MITPSYFFKALSNHGVDFYTGVPDSLLKSFCAYITDSVSEQRHVVAANEGAAVGLAVGYYLSTGQVPVVYMQNSGLGNAVNPLVSLVDPQVYGIPMLLLIGWRGEPDIKDEPQHIKQGAITLDLLTTLGISYDIIDSQTTDIDSLVERAVEYVKSGSCARAIVVRKGSFAEYAIQNQLTPKTYGWNRESAIKIITECLEDKDIVIATTGMASRELFEHRAALKEGHYRDFLTVGGMGHASQIAAGIATGRSNRRVVCIDGDGAAIMHMGSLAVNGQAHLSNLFHIVINNAAHDSVGGQPTAGVDLCFAALAKSCGYHYAVRCEDPTQALTTIRTFLKQTGPALLELRVVKGHRSNLGRPTLSPRQNCAEFIKFVRG